MLWRREVQVWSYRAEGIGRYSVTVIAPAPSGGEDAGVVAGVVLRNTGIANYAVAFRFGRCHRECPGDPKRLGRSAAGSQSREKKRATGDPSHKNPSARF